MAGYVRIARRIPGLTLRGYAGAHPHGGNH